MKKLNIKLLWVAFVSFLISSPFFAADAKVTYIKGKVEVSRNGQWIALSVGDTIAQSETINTGFQSEARLNLNGSVLAVPALTRVTLETLSTSETKDKVSLYVDTGSIRSKVTHTDNKKIDYTARTAVAVASVRGTDFVISAKGAVSCREGAVAVYSAKKYNKMMQELAQQEAEQEEDEGEEAAEGSSETASTDSSSESTGDSTEVADSSSDSDSATPAAGSQEVAAATETKTEETPAPVTQAPATSTTPAVEISSNAPGGTVVVGAGQSTTFTPAGNPEKPQTDASQKSTKIKTQVTTMGEKATETPDTGSTPVTPPSTEPKKGTLIVTVTLEN